MELKNFFLLLKAHRLTLIIVPVIAVIATFFLVRNLPDVYISKSLISTGITDQSQNLLTGDNTQEAEINQEFSNLVQMLKLDKLLMKVSYQLILHDLKSSDPFRKPSSVIKDLSPQAKQHAIKVYATFYAEGKMLSLWDSDQKGLFKVIESMKYDPENLLKKLNIYRSENSDFITVEFTSENPELSAMVANLLTREFINYYTIIVKGNQQKAVNFLSVLLKAKQDSMLSKMAELRDYKIRNRVLNLNEQAKSLYAQLADFETRREQVEKDLISYQLAINNIDKQFDPKDRRYLESTVTRINQDIISTRQQLNEVNNNYILSNFDPKYQNRIDSLERKISNEIAASTDKYIYNPLAAKQDLVAEKLKLQINLELAKGSVNSINNELVRLNNKLDRLVPNEAVIQSLESDIDVKSKEYLEILQKYNNSSMQSNLSVKLRQEEVAMPGAAEPSKKMLLVILSGIISFVFCLVVLFVFFYFDESVRSEKELANKTELPVIGDLKLINGSSLDIKKIWTDNNLSADIQTFKDQLRALRFEINRDRSTEQKILALTSIHGGEGKTLIALNLAYAFAISNKKVLIIDGNFEDPALSVQNTPGIYIEDVISNGYLPPAEFASSPIQIIGNKGADVSLFELGDPSLIKTRFEQLKSRFDIILVETASLADNETAKEWYIIADKIISVFEYGKPVKNSMKIYRNYLNIDGKFIGWIFNKTLGKKKAKTAK